MSRRRGEFEHRTSIFEGAFRAWSHLGGLSPEELETKSASDLDPLTNPLESDPRLGSNKDDDKDDNGDDAIDKDVGGGEKITGGGKRREYPYEPLPRSGLAHPFVQAILSPWLGPDADKDAIQLGLTTLRTWWQHRRKGESGSAIAALGTEKMKGVVDGYTRHFFNLAHCLVTNDGEQPPRTLNGKMREVEKARNKRNKKRAREEEAGKLAALALNAGLAHGLGTGSLPAVAGDATGTEPPTAAPAAPAAPADPVAAGANLDIDLDPNLSPLERLHEIQRRQLAESGGVHSSISLDVRGKCMPGKIDLPELVGQVSARATQIAHRGALASATPPQVGSSGTPQLQTSQPTEPQQDLSKYGDPNKTPVVFVSGNGDIQIAMSVDGITCAHCVKIVETVLKGCNGNKSPIDGLLDAAADRSLNAIIIKIDKSSNAKRIAFESARNLAMVGYTAKSKEMELADVGSTGESNNPKVTDLNMLSTAFEVVASTEPSDVFNWNIPCECPDNGIVREDCPRHSQMNKRIFDAFDKRQAQITEYMAGCGRKFGMECTCGPGCTCKGCEKHNKNQLMMGEELSSSCCAGSGDNLPTQNMTFEQQLQLQQQQHLGMSGSLPLHDATLQQQTSDLANSLQLPHGLNPQQLASVFGASGLSGSGTSIPLTGSGTSLTMGLGAAAAAAAAAGAGSRGNSVVSSWGGSRRGEQMSITSETTFGRAMSGLSALSIDWENMEDFDVNLDHSAHINVGSPAAKANMSHPANNAGGSSETGVNTDGIMEGCGMMNGGDCTCGPNCLCDGCPIHDTANATMQPPQMSAGTRRSSSLMMKTAPSIDEHSVKV